jgi:hypothetical protein
MAARTAEPATNRDEQRTAERGGGGSGLERVTVNLSPRASRALEIATGLTGESKTDAINRALQIYAFVEQITDHGGAIYAREATDAELERLKLF